MPGAHPGVVSCAACRCRKARLALLGVDTQPGPGPRPVAAHNRVMAPCRCAAVTAHRQHVAEVSSLVRTSA